MNDHRVEVRQIRIAELDDEGDLVLEGGWFEFRVLVPTNGARAAVALQRRRRHR